MCQGGFYQCSAAHPSACEWFVIHTLYSPNAPLNTEVTVQWVETT